MDLSQFTVIAILSVFSTEILEATSLGSKELDRLDGYDLQRGPVFYEAYYPDDQGPAATDQDQSLTNPQATRRYYNRASVLEKTYQALEVSKNDIPHERRSTRSREQLFLGDYNAASNPTENSRSIAHESKNPMDLRTSSEQAYELARQLKTLVEGLERNPSQRNDLNSKDFQDQRSSYGGAVTGQNFDTSNPYPQTNYETSFPNENFNSDRRLADFMNIILSAVKKEAFEISKGRPRDVPLMPNNPEGNVSRQLRYVQSEDSFDRPRPEMKYFQGNAETAARFVKSGSELPEMGSKDRNLFSDKRGYSNYNDQFDTRNAFGIENHIARDPISQMEFPRVENIFQPRPQVINYVFTPTRTPAKILSSTGKPKSEPPETRLARLNDQPLEKYGDDLIQNEMRKKSARSNEVGIASIKVGEVPRHKVRHHHDERPRRNH